MNQLIQDQTKKILAQKEQIIKDKFLEIGIDESKFDELINCRFPKITKEVYQDQTETYYYNDGSKDGLRVVTFKPMNISTDLSNVDSLSYQFTYLIQYY